MLSHVSALGCSELGMSAHAPRCGSSNRVGCFDELCETTIAGVIPLQGPGGIDVASRGPLTLDLWQTCLNGEGCVSGYGIQSSRD